jgi:hypothetical protein
MQHRKSQFRSEKLLGGALFAVLLTASGLHVWADKDKDVPAALPVEQVITCLRTAVAAKPGRVVSIENETEKGRLICEVKVRADDGIAYEVEVDVALNKVLKIERDDDEDDQKPIRT